MLSRKTVNSSNIRNDMIPTGKYTNNNLKVETSKAQLNKPEILRIRRQISSQNVFHNISSNRNDYFQSSAAIKVLTPLNGDSGMFLPGMDYPDSSLYEFVTEMSDKEFESLGFPVSPKPTDSFRLSGNDHDYGLMGSLGDHYSTDTGGGWNDIIDIISRELFLAAKKRAVPVTSSSKIYC